MTHPTDSSWLWIGSFAFIFALLFLDLGVLRRRSHTVGLREALIWSIFWISVSLFFNAFVYFRFGAAPAVEFFTGYVIEYSLSVDNLFVFLMLFSYFRVPAEFQQRVLFFGILGAIVMRGIFIFAGVALIQQFHWILFLFGIVLVVSGVKLFFQKDDHLEPEKNPVYRWSKRLLPLVPDYDRDRFFTRKDGKLFATPLFLVLISVEVTDLIFAVDSIPAIFAITTDPFIVFTSNIFAVLGLRSLFFLLSGSMAKIEFLKYGLALILCFVGVKMLIEPVYDISNVASLLIILTILGGSIGASLMYRSRGENKAPDSST